MARDTVTVPREPTQEMCECGPLIGEISNGRTPAITTSQADEVYRAMIATAPSSDPEGGARGVQTSIATKQEPCPESAPRTETAIREVLLRLRVAATRHLRNNFVLMSSPPQSSAAWEIRNAIDQELAQLTKTPSAGHDDGNLRSLAAPNHQPHAVSQGWRDIETAPKDGTRIIAVGWDWGIVGNERHVTTVIWRQDREEWCESDDGEDGSACAYLTHWMPLPAPPSPAKTGGAE